MSGFVLQVIILLRFICFIALFYLMLHILVSRVIKKPEHKVLWFFSVLTGPLTGPVRVWLSIDLPEQRLRWIALMFYGVLWLVAVALTRLLSGSSPQSL
jgi:uncharacterized protein YggT (Ycf19 family)